ncbi:hypothetical protein MMC18_007083 [Xylographa bjoerkii]|nr:hypothetical protein [Xylographa bjoerkii]
MSAHTLIWSICRKKLPAEVTHAYEVALKGGPLMDWNMEGRPIDAPISLQVDEQDHDIYGVAHGPPQGICSTMCSRYCHRENDCKAAPYVVSLTTNRTDDPNLGGSFYHAMHGIMVTPATNTLTVHESSHAHGTTDHDIDWQNWKASIGEGNVTHRGLGYCIPGKLVPLFKKIKAAKAGEMAEEGAGKASGGHDSGESEKETEEEFRERYRREGLAILEGELRTMNEQVSVIEARR